MSVMSGRRVSKGAHNIPLTDPERCGSRILQTRFSKLLYRIILAFIQTSVTGPEGLVQKGSLLLPLARLLESFPFMLTVLLH